MLLFYSGVEKVPNGCTHVQRKEKIEVVVGANLNPFFFAVLVALYMSRRRRCL